MALATSLPTRLPFSTGTTYYVDPVNGSNSNTSTQAQTRTTAWATINYAMSQVPLTGGPKIVVIGNGVSITQTVGGVTNALIRISRNWDTANPLTIQAETNQGITLTSNVVLGAYSNDFCAISCANLGGGVRIQGFVIDKWYGANYSSTTSNFYGEGTCPILLYGGVSIELYKCKVSRAAGIGYINGGASGGQAQRIDIYSCWFENNGIDCTSSPDCGFGAYYWGPNTSTQGQGTHHIYAGQYGFGGSTTNCVIANSVFYGGMPGYHIEAGPQFRDSFIVNNTFVNSRNGNAYASDFISLFTGGSTPTKNVEIRNNIFYDGVGRAVYGSGGSGQGNVAYNTAYLVDASKQNGGGLPFDPNYGTAVIYTTTGGNNQNSTDPIFTNAATKDYTLQSTSTVKASALDTFSPTTDYLGNNRSATPSRGAYEYAAGGVALPANTIAPAVTGTTTEGQTLTCSSGTWSGSPTSYAYQWQRDTNGNGVYADIAAATAATRVLAAADVSCHLRCTVTATNASGSAAANSAATAIIAALAAKPSCTVNPSIGSAAPPSDLAAPVGTVLTSTLGTWTNTPTSYTITWYRQLSGVNTSTGTTYTALSPTLTYTTVTADIGYKILPLVSATNATGTSADVAADFPTKAVTGIQPANTVAPAVTGTTVVGQTLTCSTGTWTGTAPITYSYIWQRDSGGAGTYTEISGATASTYVLVTADVGCHIRCIVTASNPYT